MPQIYEILYYSKKIVMLNEENTQKIFFKELGFLLFEDINN